MPWEESWTIEVELNGEVKELLCGIRDELNDPGS